MHKALTHYSLAIAFIAFSASSCASAPVSASASTQMSTLAAPDIAGQSFRTILVVANFEHIGVRRATEEEFAKHSEYGVRFLPSYRLFFPGRTFSQSEIASSLETNGIEASLVLDPLNSGETSTFVPPSFATSCVAWSSLGGCTQTVTSQTSIGANITKPWVSTSVMLFESRSGRSIWVASGITGGNAFAETGTLLQSIVARVVAGLESDGVTDRDGCLLGTRESRMRDLQARIAVKDSTEVFRLWLADASRPSSYPVPAEADARAQIDSLNARLKERGDYAARRLAAVPSPAATDSINSTLERLRRCSGH